VPQYLWSTDFDGTLYSGARKDACVSIDVVNAIVGWISLGGYFHVLSGGSMAGMARDGFDLVQLVYRELSRGEANADAIATIKEQMSFSMSNGTEHYVVRDPLSRLSAGQLEYVPAHSLSVPRSCADDFSEGMHRHFGMETIASDQPLDGRLDLVSTIFLKQLGRQYASSPPAETVALANDHLRRESSPIHLVFIREEGIGKDAVRRFDGYPRGDDGKATKAHCAERVYSNFESVLFTGDQPDGNDEPVFRYANTTSHVSAVAVRGPQDVLDNVRRLRLSVT